MNKKQTNKFKEVRSPNNEATKMNNYETSKKKKELPWWVELLFVQVGLPDKLLYKILKFKKKSKEFINKDKKTLIKYFFVIAALVYFFPVIRNSQNKLYCEAIAKDYILKNKNIKKINNRELRMLSTNFCNGGEEIYEIENLRN